MAAPTAFSFLAPPDTLTWVIGAGGLLGSRLAATLRRSARGGSTGVLVTPISWGTDAAADDLRAGLDRLCAARDFGMTDWRIAWCAGAGVTGTSKADLEQEVSLLEGFLGDLAGRASRLSAGTFFLSSSAGGVYAGRRAPAPFSEADEPVSLSAYGDAKLACERAVTAYGDRSGSVVQLGRIANLYGPGQNLAKAQGLVSHLCRANLSRQPISLYVSLDTIRDYLFVDDCADMIAQMLDERLPEGHPADRPVVKVLASQRGTTIGTLIATCRQIFKRPPRIVLGTSATARLQVKDLRLMSVVWPGIDRRMLTSLPAGIAATAADMLRVQQNAR